MPTVPAAQLIYAPLEPAYSPRGKAGFQVGYASSTLSEAAQMAIAERVQCFWTNHPAQVRYQFFVLAADHEEQCVFTRTVPIASHPEIVDRYQRGGAFLAHCLILPESAFRAVDYDPLAVLAQGRFITSIEEAIRDFGRATGRAPITERDIQPTKPPPISSPEVKRRLTLAAACAASPTTAGKRRSLVFVGPLHQVIPTLAQVLSLLPGRRRLACTFDTAVDHCTVPPGTYWAVGCSTPAVAAGYIELDLSKPGSFADIAPALDDTDLFEAWLRLAGTRQAADRVLAQAPEVAQAVAAFAAATPLHLEERSLVWGRDFFQANQPRIEHNLIHALTTWLGPALAPKVLDFLRSVPPDELDLPALLTVAATRKIESPELMEWLADWLLFAPPTLRDADWRTIQVLAERTGNIRVLFLSAVLSNKIQPELRREALARMNSATFRALWEAAQGKIAPMHFVSQQNAGLLLSLLGSVSAEELLDLIKALIAVGAAAELPRLHPYLVILPDKSLATLTGLLHKHAQIPPEFVAAVQTQKERSRARRP